MLIKFNCFILREYVSTCHQGNLSLETTYFVILSYLIPFFIYFCFELTWVYIEHLRSEHSHA